LVAILTQVSSRETILAAVPGTENIQRPSDGQVCELPRVKNLTRAISMEYLSRLPLRANGPNCWSAALLTAGLLDQPRHVTRPEFWFWLNSPYCHSLLPEQVPREGDIGSLFWPTEGNFHSFIHLNQDFVFSKNSPHPEHRYSVQRYEDMINTDTREGGGVQVIYHRCRPLPSNLITRFKRLLPIHAKLAATESEMQLWTLYRSQKNKIDFERSILKLGSILKSVRALKFDGQEEFARTALEYKAIGLLLTDLDSVPNLSAEAKHITAEAYAIQKFKSDHLPSEPSSVIR
jgi:hypothetical protein